MFFFVFFIVINWLINCSCFPDCFLSQSTILRKGKALPTERSFTEARILQFTQTKLPDLEFSFWSLSKFSQEILFLFNLKFVSRFSISIFPFTWWTLNLLSFEANDKKWLSVLFRFIWSFVYRSLIVSLYQRTSTNIQKLTLNSWLSWRIEAKMLRNSTEISRGTGATPSQIKTKQENSNFQDFRDF